jgi:hypothetical protein
MHVDEKSDGAIVPMKRSNKGGQPPAEVVEGRALIVSAFLTVLAWWLERKPRLPPSQIDAMFRRLVINGIGGPSSHAKSRRG